MKTFKHLRVAEKRANAQMSIYGIFIRVYSAYLHKKCRSIRFFKRKIKIKNAENSTRKEHVFKRNHSIGLNCCGVRWGILVIEKRASITFKWQRNLFSRFNPNRKYTKCFYQQNKRMKKERNIQWNDYLYLMYISIPEDIKSIFYIREQERWINKLQEEWLRNKHMGPTFICSPLFIHSVLFIFFFLNKTFYRENKIIEQNSQQQPFNQTQVSLPFKARIAYLKIS